jgi:hypothetical protein
MSISSHPFEKSAATLGSRAATASPAPAKRRVGSFDHPSDDGTASGSIHLTVEIIASLVNFSERPLEKRCTFRPSLHAMRPSEDKS